MEKKIVPMLILAAFLFSGGASLFADETVKKESAFKQIASIEGRGVVNFVTAPAELVYTALTEKKEHPKAWPATYIPRLCSNLVTRAGSSVYDIFVLPWHAAGSDAAPLTRHFALPDYVWQKE